MTSGKTLALVLALTGLVGCGDDDGGAADAQKFLGTWTYTGGDVTVSCPGDLLKGRMPKVPLANQTFTLAKGTNAPLVYTRSTGGTGTCTIDIDASGSTASARAGKTCDFSIGNTIPELPANLTPRLTIQSWTLTSADGVSGTVQGTGKVEVMLFGLSVMCTATEMGTATKAPPAGGADAGR